MTERDLVKGCIREVRSCQEEVFRRYGGKMLNVCRRYTRHYMEAEDILQDAFIQIFDKVHTFKFKGSFEGWIRRIVVNTALKNYQRSRFQKEQIGIEEYPDNPTDPTVFSQMGKEKLLELVAELPTGYRIVFNLYAIEGYSHKEIADMLGIGESTSRSQLVKARKLLQSRVLEMERVAVI